VAASCASCAATMLGSIFDSEAARSVARSRPPSRGTRRDRKCWVSYLFSRAGGRRYAILMNTPHPALSRLGRP
jgi:hypothetical protein